MTTTNEIAPTGLRAARKEQAAARKEAAAKQRHPAGKALGEPATDTLTAADRCDGCGAGALYRLAHGMKRLLFCHHHYGKHLPKLTADGWGVDGVNTDLMEALYADRTTGDDHA